MFNRFITIKKFLLSFILLSQFYFIGNSQQYNVAGSAIPMATSGCYRLTNTTSQSGAVWNVNLISLTQAFDITLTLNFGNRPGTIGYVPATCGADGISFVLQPIGNGVFGPGGGVGFAGITPSLGVIMDTYTDNPTDPTYQHISIHKNGDVLHGNTNELTPYTSATGMPVNLTDGLDHLFRFIWLPGGGGNGTIMVFFGNATTLPGTPNIIYTGNVINTIFSGNPLVYWGVSGSTGGCWNTQYVCMTTLSNFTAAADTCVGSPVSFTSTSISGLPISSYSWNFGDGGTSNLQNPTHIYTTPGTYTVSLSIGNTGGFTHTNSHPIIIHPRPTVIVNDTSLCIGDSVLLQASGALTYLWSTSQTTSSIQVNPIISSSYIVIGANSFGCKNKDTALVKINPNPNIIISNDTSICDVDTIQIFASGGDFYSWSNGQTNAQFQINPIISTLYEVTVTDSSGCKSDSSVFITVNHKPIITLSNDTTVCSGSKVIIEATGGAFYVWSTGDSTSFIEDFPNANTNYSVIVSDSGGCVTTDDMNVEVVPYPIPQFLLSKDTICKGASAIITASGADNFYWNTGAIGPTISVNPIKSTSYRVVYSNEIGNVACTDTIEIFVGVEPCNHFYFPKAFTPNNDGLNDEFGVIGIFDYILKYDFYVYDRWGKMVFHSTNINDKWKGRSENGEDLMGGVYTYYAVIQETYGESFNLYGTFTMIK